MRKNYWWEITSHSMRRLQVSCHDIIPSLSGVFWQAPTNGGGTQQNKWQKKGSSRLGMENNEKYFMG